MLARAMFLLVMFTTTTSYANDPTPYTSAYWCGDRDLTLDVYGRFWGCQLNLPNGGYIYGPHCDSRSGEERPWSDYGVTFTDYHELLTYNFELCAPLWPPEFP